MSVKKEPTFSEAFAELETLTRWFESDEFDLDKALKNFEKGLELARFCKTRLQAVENKVIELKEKYSGE